MSLDEALAGIEDSEKAASIKKAFEEELSARNAGLRTKLEAKAKTELEKAQLKINELAGALEEVKQGNLEAENNEKTDMVKVQRQLDALTKQLEKERVKAQELERDKLKLLRDGGVDKLLDKFEFVSEKAKTSGRYLLNEALKDVEDLSDEYGVKDALSKFREDHPFLIAAPNSGGSGVQPRDGSSSPVATVDPERMTDDERRKHLYKLKNSSLYG